MIDRVAGSAGEQPSVRVPRFVPFFNKFARRMLKAGTPMGPNVLVTIRGRTSGVPRTTPLAIVEHSGRRWIWAPFGDVDWVLNLRAAGEATITAGRRAETVTATELDATQRVEFFRDVMTPVATSMPLGKWFVGTILGTKLDDPEAAAEGRPVFELRLTRSSTGE